jgi:hypothetical protein
MVRPFAYVTGALQHQLLAKIMGEDDERAPLRDASKTLSRYMRASSKA